MTKATAAPATTEQPNDSRSADRIVLDVDKDGWTGQLQLSINLAHANGGGHGYRLAGPKFNGSGKNLLSHDLDQRDADEIRSYLDAAFPRQVPSEVWWLDFDGDPVDPEVFATERTAKDDAIRVYREANDLTDDYLGWLGKELPDFAWREHHEGGTELFVDAEATGMIVRQLTVKGTQAAVTTHGR